MQPRKSVLVQVFTGYTRCLQNKRDQNDDKDEGEEKDEKEDDRLDSKMNFELRYSIHKQGSTLKKTSKEK